MKNLTRSATLSKGVLRAALLLMTSASTLAWPMLANAQSPAGTTEAANTGFEEITVTVRRVEEALENDQMPGRCSGTLYWPDIFLLKRRMKNPPDEHFDLPCRSTPSKIVSYS